MTSGGALTDGLRPENATAGRRGQRNRAEITEFDFPAHSGDWQTDLVNLARQAHAIMRRHPWLPAVFFPSGQAGITQNGCVFHPASPLRR